MSDNYITAKIVTMFLKDPFSYSSSFPETKIKIETKDGVVYLSGTVHDEQQAEKAIHLVGSVSGVSKVLSDIKVKV